jgi:hypothetical protein
VTPEVVTGSQVLPLMWVFTYKFDTKGYLSKYKARLVVRGDLQVLTAGDTYAATLAARVFRTLIAVAAHFDLDIWQFDAINAFTNSKLDETIYVEFLPGFRNPQKKRYYLLIKALYGLTRSPLLWFNELSQTVTKLGFKAVLEASCLFVNKRKRIVFFFYVDDICVLAHPQDKAAYDEFRQQLLQAYKIREIGALKWFLGIRILRDRTARKL